MCPNRTLLPQAEIERELLEILQRQLLTPASLERHFEGMTEKLRSGVNGKVREAIQQSVAKILVSVDGTITLETKPDGLLGVEGIQVRLGSGEEIPVMRQAVTSSSGRHWQVINARHGRTDDGDSDPWWPKQDRRTNAIKPFKVSINIA